MSSCDSKVSPELLCTTELSIQHGSVTVAHDSETRRIYKPYYGGSVAYEY